MPSFWYFKCSVTKGNTGFYWHNVAHYHKSIFKRYNWRPANKKMVTWGSGNAMKLFNLRSSNELISGFQQLFGSTKKNKVLLSISQHDLSQETILLCKQILFGCLNITILISYINHERTFIKISPAKRGSLFLKRHSWLGSKAAKSI